MATEKEDRDDVRKTRELIAENIRRVEEMLRFLPLPDGTVNDLRAKIGLLRTTTGSHSVGYRRRSLAGCGQDRSSSTRDVRFNGQCKAHRP